MNDYVYIMPFDCVFVWTSHIHFISFWWIQFVLPKNQQHWNFFFLERKEKSNSQSDGHADDDSLMMITVECSDVNESKKKKRMTVWIWSQLSLCVFVSHFFSDLLIHKCLQVKELNLSQNSICVCLFLFNLQDGQGNLFNNKKKLIHFFSPVLLV